MQPDLVNRQALSPVTTLTDRQRTVLSLATQYYAVAEEWPSTGWISRRLHISRKRAWQHMNLLRERNFLR